MDLAQMFPFLFSGGSGGPFNPAMGSLLAQQPEAAIPALAESGIAPPASAGFGDYRRASQDLPEGGMAPAKAAPDGMGAFASKLQQGLKGVQAPAAPQTQRISSPNAPVPRPLPQNSQVLAMLMNSLSGKAPDVPLGLGALLGYGRK
jgi:hypothetical protein